MTDRFLIHLDVKDNDIWGLPSSHPLVREAIYYTNLRDARPKDRRRHAMDQKIPFIPADDRLLIEPDPITETYGSMGIVIPDNAREMPQIGTVRAVGPGRFTETADFIEQRYRVGQRVLLSKFSGSMINFFGKEYRICQQAEIMGEIVELEKEPSETKIQPDLHLPSAWGMEKSE